MRSVVNKRETLLRSSSAPVYDVIMITETWLNASHHDGEIFSNNYKVFRKDRCNTNVNTTRGGGVLVAIKDTYDCDYFKFPFLDEI